MVTVPSVQGRLLARNTLLNFGGYVLPLVVGVVTVPLVISGLGTERYGIWSLVAVVVSYFVLFDLGLGRATNKFVSELIEKSDVQKISATVWTCLASQLVLGAVGALAFALLTPLLISNVLNIPIDLRGEARNTFYLMSASIPLFLASSVLNGVLEANRRFDLANAVRIPSNTLVFIAPVVGLWLGFNLPEIVALVLAIRSLTAATQLFLAFRIMPVLRQGVVIDTEILPSLLTYGGWITIIIIVSQLNMWIDKILIGIILSLTAVAYYTPAQNLASYLWLIPSSFFLTLFPVASALGTDRWQELELICTRSIKYIILILGPIVLVMILFGRDILRLWLGDEFSENSTRALQILAVGFFLNSLQWVPGMLLQGVGKPSVAAKVYILELPIYLILTWVLINKMGIEGAAIAWAIRGGAEALIINVAAWKAMSFRASVIVRYGIIRAAMVLAVLTVALAVGARLFHDNKAIEVPATVVILAAFSLFAWYMTLDSSERAGLKSALSGSKSNLNPTT